MTKKKKQIKEKVSVAHCALKMEDKVEDEKIFATYKYIEQLERENNEATLNYLKTCRDVRYAETFLINARNKMRLAEEKFNTSRIAYLEVKLNIRTGVWDTELIDKKEGAK